MPARARRFRRHGVLGVESARPRRRGDGGLALVRAQELLGLNARGADMVLLKRSRRNMRLRCDGPFLRRRRGGDSARSAVKAHAIDRRDVVDRRHVVDDDRAVIDGRHLRRSDVVHRGIVEETLAFPASAFISTAGVAEAVVDAAVKSDMRSPIAAPEDKDARRKPSSPASTAIRAAAARPRRPGPSNSRRCSRPSSPASNSSREREGAADRSPARAEAARRP